MCISRLFGVHALKIMCVHVLLPACMSYHDLDHVNMNTVCTVLCVIHVYIRQSFKKCMLISLLHPMHA